MKLPSEKVLMLFMGWSFFFVSLLFVALCVFVELPQSGVDNAKYAMAVYAGIVREVYEIESWHRAGETTYKTRDQTDLARSKDKRWEFVGKVASAAVRELYLGRSVAHLFRDGQQSPIVGVGLE